MFRFLKNLLNIKVILGAVFFAVGVFAVLVGLLWSARAKGSSPIAATAILKIIEAPTQTPLLPSINATPSPTSPSSQRTPLPSGDITIGSYVQVSGTGGDGLRLHDLAGVSSNVNYIAIEAEVFLVKDGPIDTDGYVWWQLEDPYTDQAVGWGVANYLVVVQNP
ncbi:MAG: hypothetical protein WAV05_08790 [Anaerolineales bacterium]